MYWITGILGAFSFLAPFIFRYTENIPALWTSIVVGSLVLAASYIEAINKDKEDWEYWLAELVGIFAIVAPFLFNFTTHLAATWTSIGLGGMIALTAGSRIWIGQPIHKW